MATHSAHAGILERVGDTNTRIKDAATESVLHLASVPAVGLAQATGLLVKCASCLCCWSARAADAR